MRDGKRRALTYHQSNQPINQFINEHGTAQHGTPGKLALSPPPASTDSLISEASLTEYLGQDGRSLDHHPKRGGGGGAVSSPPRHRGDAAEGGGGKWPLSLALSEFHFLLLYPRRLQVPTVPTCIGVCVSVDLLVVPVYLARPRVLNVQWGIDGPSHPSTIIPSGGVTPERAAGAAQPLAPRGGRHGPGPPRPAALRHGTGLYVHAYVWGWWARVCMHALT